jgi:acetyl esterase
MPAELDPVVRALLPKLPLGGIEKLTPEVMRKQLTDLAESRKNQPAPEPAAIADTTIPGAAGPIRARIYKPAVLPAPTIVFFHGGGWVGGDLETHDRQARALAVEIGAVVVSVDYRRPPETRFPGAFEDCLAATRYAAARIDELGGDLKRLAVAGDSAGGNLAAAVAVAAADGGPRLAAQLLTYPVLDASGHFRSPEINARYPSRAANAEGYFLTMTAMAWFADHYLATPEEGWDPRVSPLHAKSLAGLPPAVIYTAAYDPLCDEGATYAEALRAAGVPVTYRCEEALIHGFVGLSTAAPVADAASRRMRADFKELLR